MHSAQLAVLPEGSAVSLKLSATAGAGSWGSLCCGLSVLAVLCLLLTLPLFSASYPPL